LPTQTPRPAAPPTQATKHKYADLLDQTDENIFEELPVGKLAELRNNYLQITGGDPADNERPSAEQLSALKARVDAGKSPYTDFAVFGPFGRRYAKLRKFEAQVFVHGELTTKILRGPAGYESWRACWRVFRAAMIMIGAASPASLDAYEEGIRTLTVLFPGSWGVLHMADETIRGEQWELRREEAIRRKVDLGPVPWDGIIRDSAYGSWGPSQHWWKIHVEAPLAQKNAQGALRVVRELEGVPAEPVFHEAKPTAPPPPPRVQSRPQGGAPGSSNDHSRRPEKKTTGWCHQFNSAGGCTRGDCPWPHTCSKCGKPGHGLTSCPGSTTSSGVKQQPPRPGKKQDKKKRKPGGGQASGVTR
jgi:hypothetical protein